MTASVLATVTAATKRRPAASGNKIGAAVENLASVAVTPLLSAGADLALAAQINDPREAFVTYAFVDGSGDLFDIKEGDILTVGAVDYTVRAVAEYNDDMGRAADASFARLTVEERKL